MRKLFVSLATLVLLACSASGERNMSTNDASGEQKTPVSGAISFSKDIEPLLRTRCATCHLTGEEAGNLVLVPGRAHASLVGVASVEATGLKRVDAGAPETSYLMNKLKGTHIEVGGSGVQMPFSAPPLTADEIAMIETWIKQGAANN